MKVKNIGKALIRRKTDGRYLILVGSEWPERPDRSLKPDLPGGLIEANETAEQGCAREILEETGIHIDINLLALVYAESFIDVHDNDIPANRLLYIVEVQNDPQITLSWEHSSYMWLSADEVHDLKIRKPYPAIFDYLVKTKQLV